MTGKGDFLNCSYDEVGNTDIYGCVDILKDSITCYCASISIQIAFSKSFNFLEVFLIWHKNMLFAYAADHAVLNNIFWVSVWKKTSSLRQQVCKNIFCMVDLLTNFFKHVFCRQNHIQFLFFVSTVSFLLFDNMENKA